MISWRRPPIELLGRSLFASVLTTLAVACTNPPTSDAGFDAGTTSDAPPMFTAGSCANEGQAPLRTGDGGFTCTAVGADHAPAVAMWPDITVPGLLA